MILIKGMPMPRYCGECRFAKDGLLCLATPDLMDAKINSLTRKLKSCPLVELIRCQDCDWWAKSEDSLQGHCMAHNMYPTGGYYCGTARRKEDNYVRRTANE